MFRAIKHVRSITTKMGPHNSGVIKENSLFKVHVSGLPWTIGCNELKSYFAQFGPITEAKVVFNEETGITRGFGFVSFQFGHSFGKAIETEQHMLEGRLVSVTAVVDR